MIFNNGRNELKIYWKKKIRYFSSRRQGYLSSFVLRAYQIQQARLQLTDFFKNQPPISLASSIPAQCRSSDSQGKFSSMHFQHSLFLRTLFIPQQVGTTFEISSDRLFITDWEIGLESEENRLDVMERMGHYVGYPLLAQRRFLYLLKVERSLNRKVGLVHSHLSLIIDDLASCSSKHPAYQFIILGARSFLSTLFFLCYSRNDVPKEIKVTRSQLRFFFPYRTFPKEISGSGSAPTTHQICLLFCSALYIFSSYEKEWI